MSTPEDQKEKAGIAIANEDKVKSDASSLLNVELVEPVIEINPSDACLWKFKDRQLFELGDLQELADAIKIQGQIVPIIARVYTESDDYKYEIIAGERRWRAAQIAGVKLKAIIRDLDDKEAFVTQTTENKNRKAISDYSLGIGYQKLIDNKVITVSDIQEKLNFEKSAVSNLLSFSKVPSVIWEAVSDMSKVTARTSAEIRLLANKGKQYVDALLKIAYQIREGIGARKLNQLVNEQLAKDKKMHIKSHPEKIISRSGKHLFTWKNEEDNLLSFPDNIMSSIDFEKLKSLIIDEIEKQLVEKQFSEKE